MQLVPGNDRWRRDGWVMEIDGSSRAEEFIKAFLVPFSRGHRLSNEGDRVLKLCALLAFPPPPPGSVVRDVNLPPCLEAVGPEQLSGVVLDLVEGYARLPSGLHANRRVIVDELLPALEELTRIPKCTWCLYPAPPVLVEVFRPKPNARQGALLRIRLHLTNWKLWLPFRAPPLGALISQLQEHPLLDPLMPRIQDVLISNGESRTLHLYWAPLRSRPLCGCLQQQSIAWGLLLSPSPRPQWPHRRGLSTGCLHHLDWHCQCLQSLPSCPWCLLWAQHTQWHLPVPPVPGTPPPPQAPLSALPPRGRVGAMAR